MGDRKQPRPVPRGQRKPNPPPAPPRKTVNVTVPVFEEFQVLRLRTALASGTGSLGTIEASLNIDGGAVIVYYAGRQFVVKTQDLIAAIAGLAEKKGGS